MHCWARWDADGNGTISEAAFVALCKRELDNNQRRQVVFKFMKEKDHFQREVRCRMQSDLDPRYVIGVVQTYDGDTDDAFRVAVDGRADLGFVAIENSIDFSFCLLRHW